MQEVDVIESANLLNNNDVVVFPTETVYGMGANAFSDEACRKIFALKNRPITNPLIVHVSSIEQMESITILNDYAERLTDILPAPITLVLPKRTNINWRWNKDIDKQSFDFNIASCVTAGLDTIAIRIPAHPIALDLLNNTCLPIAAPSANKSGMLSSASMEQVKYYFQNDDVNILKYTENDVHDSKLFGIESTIIDLSVDEPVILRLGAISAEYISDIIKCDVKIANNIHNINKDNVPLKAPGMLTKHYSTNTLLRLNATECKDKEIALNFGNSNLQAVYSLNLSKKADLYEAAKNLFSFLHKLDKYAIENNMSNIAIAPIPNHAIGIAINERLCRAIVK